MECLGRDRTRQRSHGLLDRQVQFGSEEHRAVVLARRPFDQGLERRLAPEDAVRVLVDQLDRVQYFEK